MTRVSSIIGGAFGRVFRDRQILIRSDHGVRLINLRRGTQVSAVALLVGLFGWGTTTTIAYTNAARRITDQAGQILDLEIGYARLIMDVADRNTTIVEVPESLTENGTLASHIVDHNRELEERIAGLRKDLAASEAARQDGEAARRDLQEHIGTLKRELASAQNRGREMEGAIAELTGTAASLKTARDELVANGKVLRGRISRLQQALATAETLNVRLNTRIEGLTTAVQDAFTAAERLAGERQMMDAKLADANRQIRTEQGRGDELRTLLYAAYRAGVSEWNQRNALQDRADGLGAQVAGLKSELATVRAAQEQLFAKLRERADVHVAAVEKGLSFTGLDIDGLIDELRSDFMPGAGGPMIPAGPGDVDEEEVLAGTGAIDLVSLVDRAAELREVVNRLPLASPLHGDYRLSSSYGTRRDPFTGRRATHYGLDIPARRGTAVFSPAPGTVTFAGRNGAYGNMIEIDHGFGITTRYGHLNRIDVNVGQNVALDVQIGLVGSTGRSTGPHLHYEVRVNNKPHNPANFLKAGKHVRKVTD